MAKVTKRKVQPFIRGDLSLSDIWYREERGQHVRCVPFSSLRARLPLDFPAPRALDAATFSSVEEVLRQVEGMRVAATAGAAVTIRKIWLHFDDPSRQQLKENKNAQAHAQAHG